MSDTARAERYTFVELRIFRLRNTIIFKIFPMIPAEAMIGIRICFTIIRVTCRDVAAFSKSEEMSLFPLESFVAVSVMFGRIVAIIDIVVNV